MEHLTKHQIVLVTLMVSFVTAVTTGIVTVSLVDQSAPTVPQIINRVVERTIEKVSTADQNAAVVTKETIVVRSEDQAIASINKNSGSIVRIYSIAPPANSADTFLGIGVIISKEGSMIADKSILRERGNYFAVVSGGKSYELEIRKIYDEGLILFAIVPPKDSKDKLTFSAVTLSATSLRLGQNVLSLGGRTNLNVTMGIVSEMSESPIPASTPLKSLPSIKTDIDTHSTLSGSPLLNLSGEVAGIKIASLNSAEENSSFYLPSTVISTLLPK